MKKTVIIFGSTTGNSEAASDTINSLLGGDVDIKNVDSVSADDLANYENLILGTSTWGIGDLQDDWEGFIDDLKDADLSNKTVAIFGTGDADSYPDSFVDGMGIIYNTIKDKSCNIVGGVSTDGYEFDESLAVVNGKFVGLPLDFENQEDLNEERISAWVEIIKGSL